VPHRTRRICRGNPDESSLTPADMHPPVDLAEDLERFNGKLATYLKPEEITRVGAAYVFADAAHRGQLRLTGDPYISHPLAVAQNLASWHLDANALMAALLHDVMEDTAITKEQIAVRFGKGAAELVDGVSKLDRIEHQSFEEAQAENFRKMLLAMARDVRVILIKLSDRLHNMQTLDALRPDKRRRIARETLDIYAPIANRLGLNALYRELQELAFSMPIRCAIACCPRRSRARAAIVAKWSGASSRRFARPCPKPALMPRSRAGRSICMASTARCATST
jgi:guanosine-3',5'-bis(diphosphate) 3'-pyrophosphohydrolase